MTDHPPLWEMSDEQVIAIGFGVRANLAFLDRVYERLDLDYALRLRDDLQHHLMRAQREWVRRRDERRRPTPREQITLGRACSPEAPGHPDSRHMSP